MPDQHIATAPEPQAEALNDRPLVVAFVADAATETALREGLVDAAPQGIEMRRGSARAAIQALQKMPTPRTLIVDVGGEDQPLSVLEELSEVVEPGVRVLVVGDREDVNFYRQLTHGLGVLEYLYKPLLRDMVARHFGPLVARGAQANQASNGGRVITVTGARGGVGASTLAANLAWYFGVEARRHTMLLDADLHRGSCATLLAAKTGSGLRNALEMPQRIDELFVERAAQPVADRLHILAGEEKLTDQPAYAPGAAQRLVEALRRRYNFVVVDAPFSALPLHRDLLNLAHQRVVVMDPTLAGARDALRLLALPNGPMQPSRAVLALVGAGRPGGLTVRQVEEALKMKPDLVIPDVGKSVGQAASLGTPAAQPRGPFRNGILALAREVAFVRLLDSGEPGTSALAGEKHRRRLAFWKRRA